MGGAGQALMAELGMVVGSLARQDQLGDGAAAPRLQLYHGAVGQRTLVQGGR